MSRTIRIPNGILTLADMSDVKCPECERIIPFDELNVKWHKSKGGNGFIRIKDKCNRFIGITADMKGKFHSFSLKS